MKIKHQYQPTGNSCGPTCLHMVYSFLEARQNDLPFDTEIKYTIDDICTMCGTDWIVGTPPDRMETGMKALGINYTEYVCSPRPHELLRKVIADKNIAIVRTITKGVPHWIIVDGFSGTLYNVLDPWQGEIQYYQSELEDIWAPRQYQFFEIIVPPEGGPYPFIHH